MSHHTHGGAADHPEPNYMSIFYALTALTVVEVGVVFLPLPRLAIGVMLVLLAFSKAILVAGYFMHLKFENRSLAIIAASPIVLCIFLMFMLLPDSDPGLHNTPPPAPAAAPAPHP